MSNNKIQIDWYWIGGLVLLLALSRLIPHPPNFTPLGAMAILAGTAVKDLRWALIIPLTAMLLSDAMIGFHSSLLFVYGAVALMVVLSRIMLHSYSVTKLALTALIVSVVFYLVTNFGAWLSHGMYPLTLNGLWQSYLAGIPFFRNTLLSNFLFTAISFYILTFLPAHKKVQV